jgi:alcohol dehydrogenase
VLGHEIVGRIEAFGPDAPREDALGKLAKIGDRITWAVAVGCGSCFYCNNDIPQKCECSFKYGHQRMTNERKLTGGLAERIVLVTNTYWLRLPDELPDHVAAPANCATATVAGLLRHGGAVEQRTVVVLGAGILGVTACAMARTAGARAVIAIDPVAECRRRALDFGATHAVEIDQLDDRIRELTDGRGADVVFELAGKADSVQSAIAITRIGGVVVLAGTVAPVGTIVFDPEDAVRRMLAVRGVHNYHPRDLATAIEFLAGPGRDFPWESLVAAEYPLERVAEAFAEAQRRSGVRVAVVPKG